MTDRTIPNRSDGWLATFPVWVQVFTLTISGHHGRLCKFWLRLMCCWGKALWVLRVKGDLSQGSAEPCFLTLYTVETSIVLILIWNSWATDWPLIYNEPLLAEWRSLHWCFVFCPFEHQDFASFNDHLILLVIWDYVFTGLWSPKGSPGFQRNKGRKSFSSVK